MTGPLGWQPFASLGAGDVFKIVDQPVAGVYVVREEEPLQIESVRHGHVVDFADRVEPVLVTKRGER